MSREKTLLIATRNPAKVTEITDMLTPIGITAVSLAAFEGICEVEETGGTFAENAVLKARGYALQTGLAALADDSGLEVAALGGRPGVLSARYGGEGLAFPEKMSLLLHELETSGSTDRSARFVSSIALTSSEGEIIASEDGTCDGHLAFEPRGEGGFGYDPIFVPEGYDRTFGELSGAIKAQISHRSRAFSRIMPILRRFFGVLT